MKHLSLTQISQGIQMIEEKILSTSILLLAGITIVNVFSRTVLNASLTFAEELAQFLIIFITFIGLSYAASKGRHIRMSALYDQLGHRARKRVMIVITATTANLMFLFAYYSLRYIATVRALGSVSPALQVPLYLIYTVAPIGFVLAGLQYTLATIRNWTEDEVYLSYQEKDEYVEVESHS
ncbi:MAG: TRAP transporter small permease [Candidatus Binatia bacterium]